MTIPVTSAAQRRAEITDAIRRETGIEEAMIERLVRGFYGRVRDDAVIGPVFAARIADWEPHLARMCAFWSSVALMTGRYHGQPMQKHLPLPVDAAHFDRWLALFEATARDLCPPQGGGSLHRTRAPHRRKPGARHRRCARRAAAERRALASGQDCTPPRGRRCKTRLPPGMKAYKRTPVFDQDSLPAGLRRSHRTKAGVWALIHVLQGSLQYRTFDPASETELTPRKPGVVRPGQLHEVQPLGPVRMFVEFYAAADVGSRPRARRLLSSSCGASEPDAPKRVRRNSERLVDRNGKRL